MVGDLHFIIRHGLTGLVFLFFVFLGIWSTELWIRGGCDISHYIGNRGTSVCTVGTIALRLKDVQALILAAAAIIGITLQGAQIFLRYISSKLFTDPARHRLADRAINVIVADDVAGLKGEELDFYACELVKMARRDPDALYVWVYHTDANERLIEWARRRRSYHYLGLHFSLSFVVGTVVGIILALIANYGNYTWNAGHLQNDYYYLQLSVQLAVILTCALWAGGAYYLSRPMKQEADSMELAWSCGRLYPDFKKKVLNENTETKL